MVKGLKSLRRKFRRTIPQAVRRRARGAMELSAQEMVDESQGRVPIGRTMNLYHSIQWTWGDPPIRSVGGADLATLFRKREKGDEVITISAGNREAFYVRWVEFGFMQKGIDGVSRWIPPQPFFFPVYRALRRRMRSRITRGVSKGIKEGVR